MTHRHRFNQFTTTISIAAHSAYQDPVPLHFAHHRSPRADAIPLLFLHGWPGSFLEAGPLLGALTDPPAAPPTGNSSSQRQRPAFHVVVPSIPGFAFSPAPAAPGFGYAEAARSFDALMRERLGYARYVIQGGDAGGLIMRYQVRRGASYFSELRG